MGPEPLTVGFTLCPRPDQAGQISSNFSSWTGRLASWDLKTWQRLAVGTREDIAIDRIATFALLPPQGLVDSAPEKAFPRHQEGKALMEHAPMGW